MWTVDFKPIVSLIMKMHVSFNVENSVRFA